jgi:alkylhydroperoxidase family enzyme
VTKARIPLPETDSSDLVARSVLGHQPETLAAFQETYAQLWSRGVLDPALKELARLRNARVTGCNICRNLRFAVDERALVPEDEVAQIRDDHAESGLSPEQKAVLAWADLFLGLPGGLPGSGAPREAKALAEHFDAAQIVELTATLALCMGFSKIAVALGPIPDDMPTLLSPMPGSEGPGSEGPGSEGP